MRGDVTDGVLTCAWHNWKFELGTGTCRYGGENIRTYPVQIRDGQVFIDIADPPTEIIRPDLFRSLTAAMDDLDISRLARDAMRLQRIGTPLADVVREGVRYAAPRAEHGWDYSLATRADCLRMSQFFDESLEALFRGLITAGVSPSVLRHTLLTAVTDHFLAYGHSMIFVQKAFELLDQIG